MTWQMILAPLGVALLVLLSWRLGAFRKAELRDSDHAREVFARDYPEKQITDVLIAEGGDSALLALAEGELGVIRITGDRYVTRTLGATTVKELTQEEEVWTLRLRDFALPHVTVRLPQAANRSVWQQRIEALVG